MNKKIIGLILLITAILSSGAAAYAACKGEIRVTCNANGCQTEIVISCEQP